MMKDRMIGRIENNALPNKQANKSGVDKRKFFAATYIKEEVAL